MTVSVSSNKIVYQGNGATTVFPFTFSGGAIGDIQVYLTTSGTITQVSSNFYTVFLNPTISPNPTSVGGTVTYNPVGGPVPLGTSLTILRVLPLTQPTSLANQGTLWQPVIEAALDTLELQLQQLSELLGRQITVAISDPTPSALPGASQRAGLLMGFDSNGNPIAVSNVSGGTAISSAMIPVVQAASLSTALNLLGQGTVAVTFGEASAGTQLKLNPSGTTYSNFQLELDWTASSGAGNSGGLILIPTLGTLTNANAYQQCYTAQIGQATSIPAGTKGAFAGFESNLATSQAAGDVAGGGTTGHLFGGTLTNNGQAEYHMIDISAIQNATSICIGLDMSLEVNASGCDTNGIVITPAGSNQATTGIVLNGISSSYANGALNFNGTGAGGEAFVIFNSGTPLASMDSSGNISVQRATITTELFFATSTPPTVSSFTGLGSGGSVTFNTGSTLTAGYIILHAATGAVATGTVVLTFTGIATNNPVIMALLTNGSGGWNARATIICTGFATTTVTLTWDNNSVNLTATGTYTIQYLIVGT